MKTPKYIQLAIKRLLFHSKVVRNNSNIVNNWIYKNNIDRSIPLVNFIQKSETKKDDIEGQLNIYDFLN